MKDQLVNRWTTAPLSEIATFSNGLWKGKKEPFTVAKVLRNTNFRPHGALSLDDVAEIEVEAKQLEKRRLQKDDIILERSGGGPKQPVGRVVLFNLDGGVFSFSNFTSVIRIIDKTKVEPAYLHQVLNWWHASGVTEGIQSRSTGIRNLDFKAYKALGVPLPPLEEQQRIVAVLDEAFEGLARARAHAEANLQNARELFESIKANALAYTGPDSKTVTLTDVADITSGLVDPRDAPFIDMLHLGAGNMLTGTDELVDVKTAREEKLISGKYLFDENKVLYSKIRPYLRKAARPHFKGLCSADVYPLTAKQGVLDRDFLFHLLLGHHFTEYAISGSDRAGMPKVNRNHMFAFSFNLPPLEAQHRIVSVIDEAHLSCSALVKLMENKIRDIGNLRQSLLQRAFAGELT